MTNTNAGKDIVLDEVALERAELAYLFAAYPNETNFASSPEFLRCLGIAILAYKAAEQKAVPGEEELAEKVAEAIMKSDGCGLTIQGKHVLCCDESVISAGNDPYGEPLYRENCHCVNAAKAAISTIRQHNQLKEGK